MYPNDLFAYSYEAGPVVTESELNQPFSVGNCRFALQLYFYRIHNKFLPQDHIYLPGGYQTLGEFVFREEPIDYSALVPGDILYAQNLKNKNGEPLARNLSDYPTKDEWYYHFHSAIYLGEVDGKELIWHATSIENGPACWTRSQFEEYYKVISAKRVL